jgi:hypothetical protein
MNHDRGTLALATAVLITAVAFGPLVPAVDLAGDSRDAEPLFSGFSGGEVDVEHRLSFRVVSAPTGASTVDGVTTAPPAIVTVAAGNAPVTLRYQLRVDDRSAERTAIVPAGEARTVTRELSVGATADRATLRVTAETPDSTYLVHEADLEVTAGE